MNKEQHINTESQIVKKKRLTAPRFLNFIKLPIQRKLLFLEVSIIIVISRLLIVILPFKFIAKFLGKVMTESPKTIPHIQEEKAKNIAQSIKKVSFFIPLRTMCFEQALSCKLMLNFRGISSTIYFGVNTDQNQKLKAHAWTRAGNLILTGANGRHSFKVVSTFGQ